MFDEDMKMMSVQDVLLCIDGANYNELLKK
jgi:hypothetical protein